MKTASVKTQIHHEITRFPDFPAAKAAVLWRNAPSDSEEMICDLFLLPFEEKIGDAEIAFTESLTLFFLSRLVRDELKNGAVFSEKEAVLYGDYLFTLAVAALPKSEDEESALSLMKTVKTHLERRAAHKKEEYSETAAAADWGEMIRDLAVRAASQAERNKEEQEAYAALGAALGALWGALYETGSASSSLYAEIEAKAENCPFGAKLATYAEKWRDQR